MCYDFKIIVKIVIIKKFFLLELHIIEHGVGLKSHPWTPKS